MSMRNRKQINCMGAFSSHRKGRMQVTVRHVMSRLFHDAASWAVIAEIRP